MKRKKKKKKRKKEVRSVAPVEEGVNPRHREFGASAVPRLPKLPAHRSLVANLWERQRQQEENVLPGSFPEFRPSCPIPYQERYGGLGYVSSNQPSRELGCNLSNPLTLSQYEGRGQLKQPAWQSNGHNGVFRYSGYEMPSSVGGGRTGFTASRSEGRKPVTAPIHSRTNLMEAELMDADSDFWLHPVLRCSAEFGQKVLDTLHHKLIETFKTGFLSLCLCWYVGHVCMMSSITGWWFLCFFLKCYDRLGTDGFWLSATINKADNFAITNAKLLKSLTHVELQILSCVYWVHQVCLDIWRDEANEADSNK